MNDAPHRASMKGVTVLLFDILDDLERAAPPQPAPVPDPSRAAKPDQRARGPQAALGDLVDRLDERGFGLLLFVLAIPCAPPFVYLLPQIVSVPMMLLAGQMAAGRRTPWFPDALRRRRFSIDAFRDVLRRTEKYVRVLEHFAHPRLRPVTGHGAARILGALLLIPSFSIMLPLPMTNTVPGIGVAIAALGLIERDGVLVVLGLLVGLCWVALLVVGAAVLGAGSYHLVLDWLGAFFTSAP